MAAAAHKKSPPGGRPGRAKERPEEATPGPAAEQVENQAPDGKGYIRFPRCLLRTLSPPQILIYLALLDRDRGNGCFASFDTLAEDVGLSRDRVRDLVHELGEGRNEKKEPIPGKGVIRIKSRRNAAGQPISNMISCLVYVTKGGRIVDHRGQGDDGGESAPSQGGESAPSKRTVKGVKAHRQGGESAPSQGGENAPLVGVKAHPELDPEGDPKEDRHNNTAPPPAPAQDRGAPVVVDEAGEGEEGEGRAELAELAELAVKARVQDQVDRALGKHPAEEVRRALQVVEQQVRAGTAKDPVRIFWAALRQAWTPSAPPDPPPRRRTASGEPTHAGGLLSGALPLPSSPPSPPASPPAPPESAPAGSDEATSEDDLQRELANATPEARAMVQRLLAAQAQRGAA